MLNSKKGETSAPINVTNYGVTVEKKQPRDNLGRFSSTGGGGAASAPAAGGAVGGGMTAEQTNSMNAATDTVVSMYRRSDSVGSTGYQRQMGDAVRSHNKAVESLQSGDKASASKHALTTMKHLQSASQEVTGIDRTTAESGAQRYSELMTRAIG